MKTKKFFLMAVSLILTLFLVACGTNDSDDKLSDLDSEYDGQEVLISVNGVEITRGTFDEMFEERKQLMTEQFALYDDDLDTESDEYKEFLLMLKEEVTENLIYQELIKQIFEEGGYEATDAEVEEEINRFIGQFNSNEEYEQFLEMQQVTDERIEEIFSEQVKLRKLAVAEGFDFEGSDADVEAEYQIFKAQQDSFGEGEQQLPPLEEIFDDIKNEMELENIFAQFDQFIEEFKAQSEIDVHEELGIKDTSIDYEISEEEILDLDGVDVIESE